MARLSTYGTNPADALLSGLRNQAVAESRQEDPAALVRTRTDADADADSIAAGAIVGDSIATDSLAIDSLASDSLAAAAAPVEYPLYGPARTIGHYDADSLTAWFAARSDVNLPDSCGLQPSLWRDTSAEALFGTASAIVPASAPRPADRPAPTGNIPFQCFVLLLAATFAVLIYRNLGDIGSLLGRAFHDSTSRKRLAEESGGTGFSRFLHIASTLGLLIAGILAVRFAAPLLRELPLDGPLAPLAPAAPLILALAVSALGAIIILYQRILLRSVAVITVSQSLVAQLILLKRIYFALTVLIAAPVVFLLILAPRSDATFWNYLLIAESVIAVILYLKESLHLFISKNFSIFHWFLYLCGVELFPLSLIWLLVVRGNWIP